MKTMKLKDIVKITDGIFQNMVDVPWEDHHEAMDLDIELLGKYGNRITSPMVDIFIEDNALPSESKQILTQLIYNKYKDKWNRLYEVTKVEYDPLETYHLTEEEQRLGTSEGSTVRDEIVDSTNNRKVIGEDESTITRDGTDTSKRTGTDKVDQSKQTTTEEDAIGEVTTNTEEDGSSTLSFIDRKDKTLNEGSSETNSESETTDNTKSTLSFNAREDTQTRNLEKESNSTVNEDTTTVDEDTTNQTNRNNVFGFNSVGSSPDSGVPSDASVSEASKENTNSVDGLTTTISTDTDTGTIIDGKTGEEVSQNSGGTTSNDQSNVTNSDSSETSKSGSEKNTTTGESLSTQNTINNTSGTISDTGESTTTYNTTDLNTSQGTDVNSSTNKQDEDVIQNQVSTGTTEDNRTDENNRTLERRGNTSGRTVPELLQEHINFWNWNFYDVVIKDVGDMLTIGIYD